MTEPLKGGNDMASEKSAHLNHPINFSRIYISIIHVTCLYSINISFHNFCSTTFPDLREGIDFINASFDQVQIVQVIKSHSPEFNAHLEPPCYHTPTTEHWI